ncbi:MAG TPA: HDOD domain-containing protein [Candidatus Dormibacteraeota bacterium]|nr:HDOD domain-containing protein [Candidatus Dormibacteraeota bacterium]
MPTATQNETTDGIFARQSSEKRRSGATAPGTRQLAANAPGFAHRLMQLLAEDPVDLARVSDEIRAQPALAAVVKRMAASLQLSPEDSVTSVEEAAIVLGTDRLRVLLYALPQFENIRQGMESSGVEFEADVKPAFAFASPDAPKVVAAWTPELFYLASFVRFLGLADLDSVTPGEGGDRGSPDFERSEAAAMTEILIRDFLALVPRMRQSPRSI